MVLATDRNLSEPLSLVPAKIAAEVATPARARDILGWVLTISVTAFAAGGMKEKALAAIFPTLLAMEVISCPTGFKRELKGWTILFKIKELIFEKKVLTGWITLLEKAVVKSV